VAIMNRRTDSCDCVQPIRAPAVEQHRALLGLASCFLILRD